MLIRHKNLKQEFEVKLNSFLGNGTVGDKCKYRNIQEKISGKKFENDMFSGVHVPVLKE